MDQNEYPRNIPGSTAMVEVFSAGSSAIPDIQILRAAAFNDLLVSELVVGTFLLNWVMVQG